MHGCAASPWLQIGCYVPALAARLHLVDRIFTRIGERQRGHRQARWQSKAPPLPCLAAARAGQGVLERSSRGRGCGAGAHVAHCSWLDDGLRCGGLAAITGTTAL